MQTQININIAAKQDQDVSGLAVNATDGLTGTLVGFNPTDVVTASWTAIDFGAVTIPNMAVIKNNDSTNAVKIAFASDGTGKLLKIPAKRCMVVYFDTDTTALWGQSVSTGCQLYTLATVA